MCDEPQRFPECSQIVPLCFYIVCTPKLVYMSSEFIDVLLHVVYNIRLAPLVGAHRLWEFTFSYSVNPVQ